jgi:hypothetical protein
MAVQAPSLGELTNIKPEATVNPGVILDSRDAVHELNQSAQFNAEMKQNRYAQQLAALKDIYQDVGTIAAMPVMPQDRPLLQKKMADILNTIGNDPHAALGGPKFGEIQRGLGELRSLSTQSKQDLVYSEAHDKIMESDPSLATPENKTKASTFDNTPLGSRQKFLFDTPVKFDPELAMGNILQQKQVAVPFANSTFEGPHSEWIAKETGTRYDRNSALGLWNQGYETGTDANNQPIKKWAAEQFQKIQRDPAQLQKFGNPKDPQEFYQNLGKMMYGSDKDIVGEKSYTRTANPYSLLGMRENAALYMEAVREGNREKFDAVRQNNKLKTAPENANFLVRQYANVLGNTTGERKPVEIGGGRIENEEVVDVPATILKNYAEGEKATVKEGQSFSPIVETILRGNTPDLTTRTADGNLRLSVYKRYDEAHPRPPGKKVGDIVTDANGNPVVDKFSVVPRRNLLATLGKGVVETKILSYSIDQADRALKNQPNDVLDKINTSDDDETVIAQSNEAKHDKTTKTYSLGIKKFTYSQIEKAAKKYGLTVDEYMKQTGIK